MHRARNITSESSYANATLFELEKCCQHWGPRTCCRTAGRACVGEFLIIQFGILSWERRQNDARVEIDCDSKLVRSLAYLYRTPPEKNQQPEPAAPDYEETETHKKSWATKLNIFVRDSGLEFYPIGGDPAELMAYMVRIPGLIPNMKSLAAVEVQKKRYMVQEMLENFWDSGLMADPLTGVPFTADAIIANPPASRTLTAPKHSVSLCTSCLLCLGATPKLSHIRLLN
ncbi:hypothetical protein FSARC_10354 [Fusarium sarcochroum]|uniref:Uncharacterized protein n=1 Tax=Fusarium sarcochroum TaxID=1208366 RepID=A0A8H4TMY1_9HYPO|nr:hypothetical protein FSARC_10354 [Fusarium sarcochroum]